MNKQCKLCDKLFYSHSTYANHMRWEHTDQTSYKNNLEIALKKRSDKRYGPEQIEVRKCEKCEATFEVTYRKRKPANRFCSRSCANSGRVKSKEGIQKLSTLLKDRWTSDDYRNKMATIRDNTAFTCRSQGEKDLLKELNIRFSDAFTYGGCFKLSDDVYLSLDCYSSLLKVCVEYDGIWHFKDIKGQLAHKQKKDNLLKEFCVNNGYQLIRVKEDRYIKEKNKVLDLVEDHIKSKHINYVEIY